MGIHLIPCVVYVRDEPTRQAAFERVKAALNTNGVGERTGRGNPPLPPLSIEFPNDEPDGAWHLTWAPGEPHEDLGNSTFYRPGHGVGQHEEET